MNKFPDNIAVQRRLNPHKYFSTEKKGSKKILFIAFFLTICAIATFAVILFLVFVALSKIDLQFLV